MTVKELIEKLQKFDWERQVWINRENSDFKYEYEATTVESVDEKNIYDDVNWVEWMAVVINAD